MISALRRALGIGLGWGGLWLGGWAIVAAIIAVVDPDSLDPGEGAMGLVVFGPMGLFSGIVFALLPAMRPTGRSASVSVARVAGWGFLACAIVQSAYLGHGDMGLVANVKMALLFSAFGSLVAVAWFAIARRWPSRAHTA